MKNIMVKNNCFLLIAVCVISFMGCKYESESNIFVSDALEVQKTGKRIDIESNIKIEIPSKSSFDEYKNSIKEILTSYFNLVGDIYCESTGMETYATAKVKIPFISAKTGHPPKKGFMYFCVRERKKIPPPFNLSSKIQVVFDKSRFTQFQKDIKNEFMTGINPEEFALKIAVHNDQRDPVDLYIPSAYIDGEACPFGKMAKIEKRKYVNVLYSDVFLAHAFKTGVSQIIVVKH